MVSLRKNNNSLKRLTFLITWQHRKTGLDFWPNRGVRGTTTCRAWVNRKQSEMFGGMGAINSNLVIRSETKGEMLEFLVLITGCVLQRQWAKAQN